MQHGLARAKINLTLHVGRTIKDPHDPFFGYHPLDSLVVFADIADEISLKSAEKNDLKIDGPFGDGLSAGDDNLILRAIHAAKADPHSVTLTKKLPVSSGLGGGSADAAAVLRLLGVDDLHTAVSLGADVPVCLRSETAHMTGIGEDVTPLPGLGQVHAVLVNPGVAVSTRDIFQGFDAMPDIRETPRPMKSGGTLLERALDGRNDLEPTAIAQAPIIGEVLNILSAQDGCDLARMSGSGATCFGLFSTSKMAKKAANMVNKTQKAWWVTPATLGDP